MNLFVSVILLGIIEGLTEFVPVSSTGHLILFGNMIGFTGNSAATFEICIQLGAILAVVVLYWQRFVSCITALFVKQTWQGNTHTRLNVGHFIVSIVPIVVVGFLLYHVIKTYLFSVSVVAWALIVGGVVMLCVDLIAKKQTQHTETLDAVTYKQAFMVGLAQCCAVCPGVSRSAATIIGGVVSGVSYKTAAEYSFLIAVPVMCMATVYDLYKSWSMLSSADIVPFLLGAGVAFIVACAAIKIFITVISKWKLVPFGWYRIGIGILVLLFCK